jgi:hypothetical protein
MAFKLASLFVEVGAQDGPLRTALNAIRGRLSDLGKVRFNIPGGGFAAMLGIAGGGALLGKAISGASDLSETLSKVGAVFGDQAGQVTKAADEMAKAFGIPKREFLDAASQFGLIAEGMGQTKAQAAEMSVKFAKLAADAASFYNVPVDVALEKIRAGLTGESEPLKAFGVIMDETTMKAYAVAHGLVKKGQELSNSAKLVARAALIEQGLATASGDLARTQDGAANQAKKFWGTLTNLGDTLGTVLLPSFTKLLSVLNEVASDMSTSADAGTGAWAEFAAMFGNAIDVAGTVYRNFGDIIERTGVMIGGYLMNAWEYLSYGGEVAASVGKYMWESMKEAFEVIVVAAGNTKDNLVTIFTEVWNYVKSGFKDPIEFKLKGVLDGMDLKGDGKFQMPELKLSGVENQLEAIDKRMAEKAQARADDAVKAAGKKAGPGGANNAGGAAAASNAKVGVTDIDTYARETQDAALKGVNVAGDQLKVAQSMDKKLDQLVKNTAAGNIMAAMGGGGPARWA